jgi:hypothetical protein
MKKIFATTLILSFSLTVVGFSHIVQAYTGYNPLGQACTDSAGNPVNSSACQQAQDQSAKNSSDANSNPVVNDINKGIKLIGITVGIASVIMIVIGGFSYVTSAGNPEKAASAKKRIIYALVGLAITALAWAIVGFVTNNIL